MRKPGLGAVEQVSPFVQGSPSAAVLHAVELGFGLFSPVQGGAERLVCGVDGVAEFVAFAELKAGQVAGWDVEGGFEGQVDHDTLGC